MIKKLEEYLSSSNLLVAFSAASALMSSKDVDIRLKALKSLAIKENITKMALLELFYKFHEEDDQHNDLEAEKLEELLEAEQVPPDNRAMLIQGITEIGYYELVNYLLEKLKEPDLNWNHPEILSALIKAQGEFNNVRSIPVIRQYLEHNSPTVVRAAINELSDYGSKKDFHTYYSLLLHEDNSVKEAALNALLNNNQDEEKLIKWVPSHEEERIKRFIEKFHTNLNRT